MPVVEVGQPPTEIDHLLDAIHVILSFENITTHKLEI
jgi:hypothetical protein